MKGIKLFLISSMLIFLVGFIACQPITKTPDQPENPNNDNLPIITTYYWDGSKGDWIKHTSWRMADLGKDLTIDIDAWNWEPEFSPLSVKFDNVIAAGDIDPVIGGEGVIDDFEDVMIKDIWNVIASEGAAVYELNGMLNIDIFPGADREGLSDVGGVVTNDFVIHGDCDVQVDFILGPGYHSTPNCNAKLFLTDQNGKSVEISIRTGGYFSIKLPGDGKPGIIIRQSNTNHQNGKLRITRTAPTGWY